MDVHQRTEEPVPAIDESRIGRRWTAQAAGHSA
jgi:hypothetical protein